MTDASDETQPGCPGRSGRTRTVMVTPGEARQAAKRRYSRIYRPEAGRLFSSLAGGGGLEPNRAPAADSTEVALSVALHPPTEQQVLANPARAREWVSSWRSSALNPHVQWERRKWPSVGSQEVPVRMSVSGIDGIAACAGCPGEWAVISRRVGELAARFRSGWGALNARASESEIGSAVTSVARELQLLEEHDWSCTLGAIDWLVRHPGQTCYVRQLPIAGIDTKWMETHRRVVWPLARAICGHEPSFAHPGKLVRVRALDQRLSLDGIAEFALSPEMLRCYPHAPSSILICENLVNVLALPPLEGVLAVHGGGYAVGDLASIPWIAETPVLYWGDLDSNGFAILNRLRSHVAHASSVMMDSLTLERHFDLCVEESAPATGDLPLLEPFEREALDRLLAGDEQRGIASLRLEQERIEWNWACERILDALRLL